MKAQLKFTPLIRGENSSGKFYLYIKVYVGRTDYSYFSTGIEIEKRQLKKGQVVGTSDAYKYNKMINTALVDLEKVVDNMSQQGHLLTSKGIIKSYQSWDSKAPVGKVSFNSFFKAKIDELVGVEKSDTLRDKRQTLDVLNRFSPDLSFIQINVETMGDFINFLKREKYADATRHKHKKNTTWAIHRAQRVRLIDPLLEPWEGLDVKRPEGTRDALTLEELHNIEALGYEDPLQQRILDAFLFSCYTGMRFSDIQQFAPRHIQVEEGVTYIRMTYAKTQDSSGAKVSLPLNTLFDGKPLAILGKYYISEKGDQPIFSSMFNARANLELKVFAAEAKIKKNLTFHMGRHTFGTLMARFTNDPFLIKALMGIKKMETVMIYIHMNQEIMKGKIEQINWNPVRGGGSNLVVTK